MADTPILDLQTLVERPFIKVDGTKYELYAPNELSIMQSQRFMNWGKRIEALARSADDDPEAETEMTGTIAAAARAALVDMPDAVFDGLSVQHRMRIIEVFTMLLPGTQKNLAAALLTQMIKKKAVTGASSSPGSAGSTAARRATGSKKRPQRS